MPIYYLYCTHKSSLYGLWNIRPFHRSGHKYIVVNTVGRIIFEDKKFKDFADKYQTAKINILVIFCVPVLGFFAAHMVEEWLYGSTSSERLKLTFWQLIGTLARLSKIFHIWSYVRSTVSQIPDASSCTTLIPYLVVRTFDSVTDSER